ncbi:MAG: ABC transporter substrate-binding protein [Rhodospirillales bacterium]|nr:ABC transporter substrate-binding protein [Rhodospirillales bacterium]
MQQGGAVVAGNFAEPVRVAILVPQSGSNAAMGQALLQAAQLAVFDLNEPNFQLIPKDTMGTPEGARMAVDQAARDGARLILGPLFFARSHRRQGRGARIRPDGHRVFDRLAHGGRKRLFDGRAAL